MAVGALICARPALFILRLDTGGGTNEVEHMKRCALITMQRVISTTSPRTTVAVEQPEDGLCEPQSATIPGNARCGHVCRQVGVVLLVLYEIVSAVTSWWYASGVRRVFLGGSLGYE